MNTNEFLVLIERRRNEKFEKVELIIGKGKYKEPLHILCIKNIEFKKDENRDGMIIFQNTKSKIPRGQISMEGIIEIRGHENKK